MPSRNSTSDALPFVELPRAIIGLDDGDLADEFSPSVQQSYLSVLSSGGANATASRWKCVPSDAKVSQRNMRPSSRQALGHASLRSSQGSKAEARDVATPSTRVPSRWSGSSAPGSVEPASVTPHAAHAASASEA